MNNKISEAFIRKAFVLASRASNMVHPNPFVGALVVKNGEVVGRGFHSFYGGPHAEVYALQSAGAKAKGAELFVTLEPCSSKGKTPPCTDIIISSGIKKVYFGAYDADPGNSRKASKILNAKGIETEFIDFQKKHDDLNRVFNHCLRSRLPYVNLKAATSLDARLFDAFGNSKWITCLESRKLAHFLRRKCDAIMIGASTFNKDNPRLNIRLVPASGAFDPAKIILSASGKLKYSCSLLSQTTAADVIILTSAEGKRYLDGKIKNKNCSVAVLSESKNMLNLKRCLTYIRKTGYHNLLVEGGISLFRQFIAKRLFNELHIVMAPVIFGGKDNAFTGNNTLMSLKNMKHLKLDCYKKINNDLYMRYICSQG